jgi:hypothetical protein
VSEITVGDTVWVPAVVEGIDGDNIMLDWTISHRSHTLPDHPALPNLARWLAENTEHIAFVREWLTYAAAWSATDERRAAMRALVAALDGGGS